MRHFQAFCRENPKGRSLTAGHVKKRAVNGGDPEVGGARVKQHGELLWGGTNADLPKVLGLWKQRGPSFTIETTQVG